MELSLPKATNTNNPSTEERDQLHRSSKKPKRKITHLIFDKNPSTDDGTNAMEIENDQPPMGQTVIRSPLAVQSNAATAPLSFRDLVRGSTSIQNDSQMDPIEEDDDVSDDDPAPYDILNDERCPAILLSKEEKRRMRRPWRNTLIVKMFDGNVGYMGLMRKLKKKWNLRGELSLTDIGHKFFIARLTNEADYNFVLIQGP